MAYIRAVATAFPEHRYAQEEVLKQYLALDLVKGTHSELISRFFYNAQVSYRNFALPLSAYPTLDSFEEKNRIFIETACNLLQKATTQIFERTPITPQDIHLLASTTVTGLSIPSLEARLMNAFPFLLSTKRIPLFGLGCVAGVAGINRVADYLKGHPSEAALFMAVELCSLTWHAKDFETAHLVSASLFGDGCAVVLMVGEEHPLANESPLKIRSSQSYFIPDSERIMGFDMTDNGFKVVLGPEVPDIVLNQFPKAIESQLNKCQITRKDLEFFVTHAGGPKVLNALAEVLETSKHELRYSWNQLKHHGNMSSVSVLCSLHEALSFESLHGKLGLMSAMGPAFCIETSILEGKDGRKRT